MDMATEDTTEPEHKGVAGDGADLRVEEGERGGRCLPGSGGTDHGGSTLRLKEPHAAL